MLGPKKIYDRKNANTPSLEKYSIAHFLSKVGCTIILAKCGSRLGLSLNAASSPPKQHRQMVPHNLQQNAAVLKPNVLRHIFRSNNA